MSGTPRSLMPPAGRLVEARRCRRAWGRQA